ncbi:MAG TPA: NAD-dependent epimerase/dehydratase family protein [Ureibacillus sp.]|nr:NAD-dependent epimerase/dehydratase family protein [Ureibacillus sp.]
MNEAMNDKVLQKDLEYIANYIADNLSLTNEKILVSGATGLVGSILIKSILCYNRIFNKNVMVIGLARSKQKVEEVYGVISNSKYLQLIYKDIRDLNSLDFKDINIDFIIHTASATNSSFFVEHPVETIEISVLGTNQILKIATEKNIKSMVYLSSMEVYGKTKNSEKRTTEDDLGFIDLRNVRSSYSEGKRISECMCVAYAEEYNTPVKIARLSQTFGAGILLKYENRIFAQIVKSVLEQRNVVLHTLGESIGNYCDTRDTVIAILILLFKGVNGEAYNICNEESTVKIRDMAEMVCREISNGSISIEYDIPSNIKTFGYAPDVPLKLSSSKMKNLGWKPQISLKESFERMIQSSQSN